MKNFNFSSLFHFQGGASVVLRHAGLFISSQTRWIRIVVFLFFAVYCFFFLYTHLFYSQLSEEKKREYINTKEKEVVFDRVRLEAVLSRLEKRRENYASEITKIPDIFHLNSPSEPPK